MVSVLEKLTKEFESQEENVSAQPSCSDTAPINEQLSCSGVTGTSRDSTFEERLVENILKAQQKQFQELQCLVKQEIAATNERIDALFEEDSGSEDIPDIGPPNKKQKSAMETDSPQGGEASETVLNRLTKLYETSENMGPAIDENLAKIVRYMLQKDIGRDDEKARNELMKKYLRPVNCDLLITPKVNKEIWSTLPTGARNKDLEVQKPQKMLINAMLPLVSSVEYMINQDPKGENSTTNKIVDNIMDAIAMLSHANNDLNGVRRNMIRPNLNTEYRALCSTQTPITDNLFGDNIAEQLKTIQEVNKVGKRIHNEDKPTKFHQHGRSSRMPFLGLRNSWASGSRKRGTSSGRYPVGMNRHQKKQRGGRQ